MSLADQAAQLAARMANREKRRAQEARRHEDKDGAYGDARPRKKRSEPLRAAQAAHAAVLAAASMHTAPMLRCELCQASFQNDAALQQHLAGPVHRKAVERAAREAAQRAYNPSAAVAREALQAAAWQDGGGRTAGAASSSRPAPAAAAAAAAHDGHGAGAPGHRSQQPGQQKQQQQRQPPHKAQQQQQAAKQQELLTHEQVLAQARQQSGPLSLDGWVPPSVPSAPKQDPAPSTEEQEAEEQPAAAAEQPAHEPPPPQAAEPGPEEASGSGSDSSSGSESGDDVPRTFESFF